VPQSRHKQTMGRGARQNEGRRMATRLDNILDALRADRGLTGSITATDLARGLAAADDLNEVLLYMIAETGVNDDGQISAADMVTISVAINSTAYAAQWVAFYRGHGNDNGTIETGYHYLQDDGATMEFRGRNFADTVVDAIYHFGFEIQNGRYFNEDGNDNETAADVAGWLNWFLNGENIVWGSSGNDELGSGAYSTYFAAARNEVFRAGDGDDRVWADIGDDTVWLGRGNDTTGGGDGQDKLYGESGNDRLMGEAGADRIYGGSGSDVMGGGNNSDRLEGAEGNDTLYGGSGNDALYGEEDADLIYADTGNDKLYGGDGNDTLAGGDDRDYVVGGAGVDNLSAGNGGDTVFGGTGRDLINLWEATAAADVVVFARGDSGRSRSSIDRVEGFDSARDKIRIDGADGMTFEDLDFRGGGPSCYYDGRHLRVDFDGDRALDMAIELAWVDAISSSNLIFN
jgi:Ca2+-binding RTX toxin-like protein